jgi:uncharacterized protein HemX
MTVIDLVFYALLGLFVFVVIAAYALYTFMQSQERKRREHEYRVARQDQARRTEEFHRQQADRMAYAHRATTHAQHIEQHNRNLKAEIKDMLDFITKP